MRIYRYLFSLSSEHSSTTGRFIKPKKHFESLINFLMSLKSATKLEIIVALYPKADLKKYPKEFKKYKLIPNKITELVKIAKLFYTMEALLKVMQFYLKNQLFI